MNIKRSDLEVISRFASVDESRYVINSIHIEPIPEKGFLLVATDGRCLGTLFVEDATVTEKEPITFPLWALKFIPRRIAFLNIESFISKQSGFPDRPRINIKANDMPEMTVDLVDGVYPKWRQVIPKEAFKPCNLCVNALVLQPFLDASKMLGISRALFFRTIDELSGISVFLDTPNFYGVIMPMRDGGPEKSIPEWVK